MSDRTTIVAFVGVLVAAIVAITIVIVTGADASRLIDFLTGALIPSALVLLNYSKTARVGDQVDRVAEQTNGMLTELVDRVDPNHNSTASHRLEDS